MRKLYGRNPAHDLVAGQESFPAFCIPSAPESEVYTMEEISTIIQQVGFPIAAFLLMWWQSNTTIKENTAAIVKLCEHMKKTDGDG
nr:MAG TPA: YvrJ protein family protein [Caudoviricetes sp.]